MPIHTPKLALAKIRRDGGTQPRADIDAETVAQYRERMEEGDTFPPVVVYFDGKDHWLADGFHRVEAAEASGWTNIEAEIHKGTQRDAILHSVGANNAHGKPRTNADKRRAVMTVLTNELVSKNESGKPWSDRAIARLCSVSNHFVAEARSHLGILPDGERAASRNGKEYTIKTGGINAGRRPTDAEIAEETAALDASDTLLADFNAKGGSRKGSPGMRIATDDPFEGGVVTTLERPVTHTTTAKTLPRRDRDPAKWEWSKAMQTIYECLNVVEQSGGIAALHKEWDVDEKSDYSSMINEVVERFTKYRSELRKL